jgi:hypothetical protein
VWFNGKTPGWMMGKKYKIGSLQKTKERLAVRTAAIVKKNTENINNNGSKEESK